MEGTCLHCGKPLGVRTKLCHECASEGHDPEWIQSVAAVRTHVL